MKKKNQFIQIACAVVSVGQCVEKGLLKTVYINGMEWSKGKYAIFVWKHRNKVLLRQFWDKQCNLHTMHTTWEHMYISLTRTVLSWTWNNKDIVRKTFCIHWKLRFDLILFESHFVHFVCHPKPKLKPNDRNRIEKKTYVKNPFLSWLHMGLYSLFDGLYKSEMVGMSQRESHQHTHLNMQTVFVYQSYRELFHHKPSVCNEN